MALQDEIKEKFGGNLDNILEIYNEVRGFLKDSCKKGGKCDPLTSEDTKWEAINGYRTAADHLDALRLFALSESLLLECWDDFEDRQKSEKQWVYKGAIGLRLVHHYLFRGDMGAALRYVSRTLKQLREKD